MNPYPFKLYQNESLDFFFYSVSWSYSYRHLYTLH